MANAKKDKYDILAKVIEALFDDNQEVKVETTTLDAKHARNRAWYITDKNNPQIPTRQGAEKLGVYSKNHEHAESIKIGKISLRRIPLEPTPIQGGKYVVDNGYKYIVRMPDGEEAQFSQNDKDFRLVWGSALTKYDMPVINGQKGRPGEMYDRVMRVLHWNLKNPKLKLAAGQSATPLDKRTKLEKARDNLKALIGLTRTDEDMQKKLAVIRKNRSNGQ